MARNLMVNSIAGFVQDDWKLSPRLTLNLGVRYDIFLRRLSPMAAFPISCSTIHRSGPNGRLPQTRPKDGSDCGCEQNYNNFAPRTGLAYRLTDKTVLRTGFGIIYALVDSYSSQAARWMNQSPDFVEYSLATIDRINPLVILKNGFPTVQLPATVGAGSCFGRHQLESSEATRSVFRAVVFRFSARAAFECSDDRRLLGYLGAQADHRAELQSTLQPRCSRGRFTPIFPFYTNVTRQLPMGNASYNAMSCEV